MYVSPEDRANLVEKVRAEGVVHNYEALLKTQKGAQFPVLISAQGLVFDGEPALLVSAHDISAQKADEAKLRQLASIDSLTGCYNRGIPRAGRWRARASLSVPARDLGRDARRRIISKTSTTLSDTTPAIKSSPRSPIVAGEPYARPTSWAASGAKNSPSSSSRTAFPEARMVAERVLLKVQELDIRKDGTKVETTLSAGVVERREGEGLEAMLRRADRALYQAKERGRNCVAPG